MEQLMKFSTAIDRFISDRQSEGRINSPTTVRSYRSILDRHATDIANRDPRTVGREDIKRTLRRWTNPNTQRPARAILVSFYDWAMEEGLRPDNPARQTPKPRARPTQVYRLTRDEAVAMLQACCTQRENRAIHIGICAGLRNAELRGLQGRHFQRDGFIWVSKDIAKGHRERYVPVISTLEPIVAEIRANVAPDEYVLPAQRWRNPPQNTLREDLHKRPSSSQALWRLVGDVGKRAGISANIHPHLLRHAFGDHVARVAGIKAAQALLGHADIKTTQIYVGSSTLDELADALAGFHFGPIDDETPTREDRSAGPEERDLVGSPGLPPEERAANPGGAVTGAEPVVSSGRSTEQDFTFDSPELQAKVALYVEALR